MVTGDKMMKKFLFPLWIVLFGFLNCQSNQLDRSVDSWEKTRSESHFTKNVFQEMIAENDKIREVGLIYFDFDKSDLTKKSQEYLLLVSKELSQCKGPILIEGYADLINSNEYNEELGYQRAVKVADYLKTCGIWEERMFLKSFGETRPNCEEFSGDGQHKNRCVAIKIFPQNEAASGAEANRAYLHMSEKKKQESNTTFVPLAITKN